MSYTVTVTVAEDTQTDTWLKNEAALTSGNTGPEQADHDVYISEIGGPRLTVTKTGPASATVGDQVTYTITVRNDGDIYASNVVVTDVLPEGLTYVSSSGNGTYDAETRTVTWPHGQHAGRARQRELHRDGYRQSDRRAQERRLRRL